MKTLFLRIAITLAVLTGTCLALARDIPHVSNSFSDTDIRVVLKEIAASTGVSIIADSSVKGQEVTMDFKDEPIEGCLKKLSYLTGFLYKKKDEFYLISMAQVDSPLFNEFAVTKTYMPRTESAASLFSLLSKTYQPYVQTDHQANLLTITAPEGQVDVIIKSLEVIDKPRRQFVVEALVTEISNDASHAAGLSWNWQNFAQSIENGLVYSKATSTDVVTLKALISNKKATLKANPRISATEGKEASITVGSETYYSVQSGSVIAPTIQFQKVNTGIHLVVTGYIEPDGMINLHLQPEVSDAAAPVGGSPTTTIRKADTYMRVHSGDAIALGGLTRELETNQEQKVPILGNLPLIGSFFRSTEKVKTTTEVVILIVPHLIEEENVKFPMKIAKPGALVGAVSPAEVNEARPQLLETRAQVVEPKISAKAESSAKTAPATKSNQTSKPAQPALPIQGTKDTKPNAAVKPEAKVIRRFIGPMMPVLAPAAAPTISATEEIKPISTGNGRSSSF